MLHFRSVIEPPLIMPRSVIVESILGALSKRLVEDDSQMAVHVRRGRVGPVLAGELPESKRAFAIERKMHGRAAAVVSALCGRGKIFASDVARVHQHQGFWRVTGLRLTMKPFLVDRPKRLHVVSHPFRDLVRRCQSLPFGSGAVVGQLDNRTILGQRRIRRDAELETPMSVIRRLTYSSSSCRFPG